MNCYTLQSRIEILVRMGEICRKSDWDDPIRRATEKNNWFTTDSVHMAIKALGNLLVAGNIQQWLSRYPRLSEPVIPKTILIVMPGNIPMVGLHDLLSVFICGHHAHAKLSTKDAVLIDYLIAETSKSYPGIHQHISLSDTITIRPQGIIATGSDATKSWFQTSYQDIPGIFRGNRNSIALLSGDESLADLTRLKVDVLAYFGLGCRNVTLLLLPDEKTLLRVKENFENTPQIAHQGYMNSCLQQKVILKMRKTPLIDAGVCILTENTDLHTPIGVVNYALYNQPEEAYAFIAQKREKIQCVVGNEHNHPIHFVPFGDSQFPSLWDYADEVDTVQFLIELIG